MTNARVENIHWKLIALGDARPAKHSEQQEAYLLFDGESHRVSGSGGCNHLTGSYELDGDRLTFGPMARTMMACVEGMKREQAFLRALPEVKKWKMAGQELELDDAAGKMVARFQARGMK